MRKKHTIESVKKFCISIGYTCLNKTYTVGKDKLNLICDNGHNCAISFYNLFYQGRRCVDCSKVKKKTIEYVREFCDKIGWKCLDNTYKDCFYMMSFLCPQNHLNTKSFHSLERKQGCRMCSGLYKPTIEEVKKYCLSVGFTCLSEEYENAHKKLKLQCYYDHIFWCCFDKIKQSRGCSECSTSRSEKMIRYIIEELLDEKFIKIRAPFLKFPKTGRKLEIDMFNERLKLGFEYQGNQHFKIVAPFKMTEKNLLDYQERDAFKQLRCIEEGIKLICIPPIPYETSKYIPQQIKQLVVNALIENDITFTDKKLSSQNILRAGNI